jgi:cytochrome P450
MSVTTTIGSAPDHVPPQLVRHVDVIGDPEVTIDPYGYFDGLRAQAPILYSTALGGFWMALGAEEVREIFQRADVFTSYPTGIPPMAGFWPRKLIPQELDGDEHRKFRRLLIPLFGPSAIKPILESVTKRAEQLIGEFAEAKEVDFIEAFAKPLPSIVFLELFGLPIERVDTFTEWSWQLLHSGDPQKSQEVGGQIVGYLIELIAQRRQEPADDLISTLIRSEVEGKPLSDEDLLDMCFLLYIAGLDTVTSQLGILFHHLARHPEQQQHLRDNPDGIPAALEELLRVFPIVPPARTLTQDFELGGVAMKAGDTVLVGVSGASRDRSVHPDGDEVDFGRGPAWNTAFGIGPHRCLGIHLARHELAVALRLMTTMVPPFALAPDASPRIRTVGNVWGMEKLPLVFADQ